MRATTWDPWPGLCLVLASLISLTGLRFANVANSGAAQTLDAATPETVVEEAVAAWASNDPRRLSRVASRDVTRRLLDDPAFHFPADTPAADGARIVFAGAEVQPDGQLALDGNLRWGDERRGLRCVLDDRHGPPFQLVRIRWAQP